MSLATTVDYMRDAHLKYTEKAKSISEAIL